MLEVEHEKKSLNGLVSLIFYLDEETKITRKLLISLSKPIQCHFQDTVGKEQIQEGSDCQEEEFRFYCRA